MAGDELLSLGRVKLTDLVASEGLPSDSYKSAVATLCQSLGQYSAAIVHFPYADAALLRSCLESARLYFTHKPPYPPLTEMIHANESRDWCKTSGYHADPQIWLETYDFRPGLTPTQPSNGLEIPPAGLPETFALLGKVSRHILDAVSFNLNLRSSPFTEILDNVPLRNQEISSSVLSVCCNARPSFSGAQQHGLANGEDGHLSMFPEQQVSDKSLLSIVKPDKAGMHVRDFQGQWVHVDAELGPQDVVVYPGLALHQATAGYINPALHRTEITDPEGNIYGRYSLAFKLMPKSLTVLNCSEMRAAGYGVDPQFQLPVPVDDFMQRSHHIDQLFNRQALSSYDFPAPQEGTCSMKSVIKRKKTNLKWKPLPPSKRLRLEAQRVLKEKVQDIADKKGIKLRFCNLKECEIHIHSLDSPCANIRLEIGWPPGVPFVHPHDLPNKAKIGFLEAYEPGWSITHDMELTLIESGQSCQHPTH